VRPHGAGMVSGFAEILQATRDSQDGVPVSSRLYSTLTERRPDPWQKKSRGCQRKRLWLETMAQKVFDTTPFQSSGVHLQPACGAQLGTVNENPAAFVHPFRQKISRSRTSELRKRAGLKASDCVSGG
jgi:hypothetical protein